MYGDNPTDARDAVQSLLLHGLTLRQISTETGVPVKRLVGALRGEEIDSDSTSALLSCYENRRVKILCPRTAGGLPEDCIRRRRPAGKSKAGDCRKCSVAAELAGHGLDRRLIAQILVECLRFAGFGRHLIAKLAKLGDEDVAAAIVGHLDDESAIDRLAHLLASWREEDLGDDLAPNWDVVVLMDQLFDLGLTNQEIAARVGMDPPATSKIYHGHKEASEDLCARLDDARDSRVRALIRSQGEVIAFNLSPSISLSPAERTATLRGVVLAIISRVFWGTTKRIQLLCPSCVVKFGTDDTADIIVIALDVGQCNDERGWRNTLAHEYENIANWASSEAKKLRGPAGPDEFKRADPSL